MAATNQQSAGSAGLPGSEKGAADKQQNPTGQQVNPPGTAGSQLGSTPSAQPKTGQAVVNQQGMAQHNTSSSGNMTGFPYMPGGDEGGSSEQKLGVTGIEAEERYGVQGKPIPADEAWVAPINNFSKKDVRAEKWKLINYKTRTITFANTFDGMLGANFKQDVATFPLDPKKARGQVAGHSKVDVHQCPVAIPTADAEAAGILPLRDTTQDSGAPVNQQDAARKTEQAATA